jgi:hypothetical protein
LQRKEDKVWLLMKKMKIKMTHQLTRINAKDFKKKFVEIRVIGGLKE